MNVFTFSTGYRPFTSYWWRSKLNWRTWVLPFKYSCQRVTRGWCDRDVWSFDVYLTSVIIGGVERLRKTKQGIPHDVMADPFGDLTDEDIAKWDAVLEKIVLGFTAAEELLDWNGTAPLYASPKYEEWEATCKAEMKEGFDLFQKHFHSLWD